MTRVRQAWCFAAGTRREDRQVAPPLPGGARSPVTDVVSEFGDTGRKARRRREKPQRELPGDRGKGQRSGSQAGRGSLPAMGGVEQARRHPRLPRVIKYGI